MKVLDLRCIHGHRFEGWFGSEDDYAAQAANGSLACPVCADAAVERLPSAPRLNLGTATEKPTQAVTQSPNLHAAVLRAVARVMAKTEDVGERFSEEARRIHYGETPERGIRGQASPEEAEALRDEGIDVMPLPVPPGLLEPMQ